MDRESACRRETAASWHRKSQIQREICRARFSGDPQEVSLKAMARGDSLNQFVSEALTHA
jgi:hypothetical protein